MEDYIPKPKTIEVTTSAAKETMKQGKGYNGAAEVDPQLDKIETSIGSGKDFDALVKTLKVAIERGDIDKENVHRLAHGLGVKPETLANMVGVDKETMSPEDQDDSPKDEVSPPDVQKDFKDFRSEIEAATSVTESSMLQTASSSARNLANLERKAGLIKGGEMSKVTQAAKNLALGKRNAASIASGNSSQNLISAVLGTSQGRQLAQRLKKMGKI